MRPTLAALTLMVLLAGALTGCAEGISSDSNQRFSELVKPYDKTLTRKQQKETISELQNDAQAKKDEGEAASEGEEDDKPAASTN
jgi:hypothetical protein